MRLKLCEHDYANHYADAFINTNRDSDLDCNSHLYPDTYAYTDQYRSSHCNPKWNQHCRHRYTNAYTHGNTCVNSHRVANTGTHDNSTTR
jgi:hypothetical protein